MPAETGVWLPLTPAQQGLFFAHQLAPDSTAYTTAEVVELDGEVDAERLGTAIDAAYAEFEQLRVRFALTPDGPRQQVRRVAPVRLTAQRADDAGTARTLLDRALLRPFDLSAGEVTRTGLLRLVDGTTWWWHAAHHVVLDAYGAHQLLRRIAELHDGAEPVDPVPLADLVAEEHRSPDSEAFWDDRLAAMAGPVSLAGRIATPAPRAIRRTLDLPDALQTRLVQGSRRLGSTWAGLVTAAAGSYLARVLGVGTGRIGLPLMNRAVPGAGQLLSAHTVCSAMNVLPASIPVAGTVAELLAAVRAETQALRRHPFERQEWLARRLARRTGADLFGMQVNLIPFDLRLHLGGVPGTVRNLTAGPVEDLTLTLRGTPGRQRSVHLELDAHPDLYDLPTLDLHLRRLRHWLEVLADADPKATVGSLPLLPEAERILITETFNATDHPRAPATLGRRFADQVARSPEATALRHAGRIQTYARLHERAGRIASGLHAAGVRAGDVVGVRLARGFGLYESVHALALLGAVYLPLDPDLPEGRIAMMLQDADVGFVIDDPEALAQGHRPYPGPIPDDMDAPAYLLFTSGSTGRPKGVVVTHRAIDNRLAWMQHHLALTPGERVLHKTPISFDVSIWELFWPLYIGGCVVIAEPGVHRDPRALSRLIVQEEVAVLHFVPSMLRAFLNDRASRETVAAGRVRSLVTSGEALTSDLVALSREWFRVAPTNLYGPTEAAVDVTAWDCTDLDAVEGHSVPIGRPVWNTTCFVLDPAMTPVGVGVAGELWLGGVQLAQGYVGRADLTAERFVETPWGRLYRTGDLAAWRADGSLRYLGRTDDQVKIRGQRVELGEIEAILSGVTRVAALAAGSVDGRLVVWYVGDPTAGDDLRGSLYAAAASALPESLLPSHWIAVEQIPLGTSGKTDRRRLVELAPPSADHGVEEGAAPSSLLEQRLCALIARVLGHDAVAADADFFTVGGDSLSVLRLIGSIEDSLGVTLGLADVFAHPTAAGLAARITDAAADTAEGLDDFAEILTLRHGTDPVPLFLLPPAGGLGWCYAGLLPDLPPGLSVHTVQASGIGEGAPEPVTDLAHLAARQLAAIRTVVGDGPFHLAGWSLGGMAAHAVATLARSWGQRVESVTLLDAYPSEQWQHLSEPTEAEALVGILRLAGLDAPEGVELTRATAGEMLRRSGSALAALPGPVLDGCIASVVEAARIVRTTSPGTLPGDLTLIVAAAPRPETFLDPGGWRSHVAGAVRVVPLQATHGELVRRPAAAEVARVIAASIGSSQ